MCGCSGREHRTSWCPKCDQAIVGERGPELIDISPGAQIIPLRFEGDDS